MQPIFVDAQLWKLTQDHDGETKITFAIPSSEIHKLTELYSQTNELLKLIIADETSMEKYRQPCHSKKAT